MNNYQLGGIISIAPTFKSEIRLVHGFWALALINWQCDALLIAIPCTKNK
ncbi:MAG: hypothetical protein ACOX0M_08540 [Salinivirgaceae bacterium]